MLTIILILCCSQILAEVTHTSDQQFLEKQPLVLLGKLPQKYVFRKIVKRRDNQFKIREIGCYLVDCNQVSTPLCQSKTDTGIEFYSHSKPIRYVGRYNDQDMIDWAIAVINKEIQQLNSKSQIIQAVNTNGYAFVYFPNSTKDDQSYLTLSRKYLTTSFYTINNQTLIEQLQMKRGNITMYKNDQLERQSFQHANSWERWESFLATYSYPGINKLDSNQLTNDRFRQSTNVKFVSLFSDLSYKSQKSIDAFYKYSKNNDCGIQLRLYLDYLRQSQMMKIYYHIRPQTYPALVYVNLANQSLTVSIIQGEFTEQSLNSFCKKAVNNELEPFYLSADIPENNGFSGKGVQKKIQKIVYNNFKDVVLNSRPTYIVMYTSVGQGCGNCEQSYNEFKKLASYLQDEDIVFARYEFVGNYIPQPIIVTIPQVVIYKQGSKDTPITQRYLTRFDQILRLIRQHIPLSSQEL